MALVLVRVMFISWFEVDGCPKDRYAVKEDRAHGLLVAVGFFLCNRC